MSKIVRHRLFELEGGEGLQIRLKKWSAGKLFLLVREFWSLMEEALEGVDFNDLDEILLIRKLIGAFVQSEKKAARLVLASIDQPSDLTEDQLLEWDASDFIAVLTHVVEMNMEEISKNFRRLLTSFAMEKTSKQQEQTNRKKEFSEPRHQQTGSAE